MKPEVKAEIDKSLALQEANAEHRLIVLDRKRKNLLYELELIDEQKKCPHTSWKVDISFGGPDVETCEECGFVRYV